MEILTKNDWDHIHDCILHFSGKNLSHEELVEVFKSLPSTMRYEAYLYGMNDTVWRNNFIEYYLGIL